MLATARPTTAPATRTPEVTATTVLQITPTSVWVHQGPDTVYIPILLYHHISNPPKANQYYVAPDVFAEQMRLLHELGYQTITTRDLHRSIEEGLDLPPRPIIITFDDGHLDNYTNAYPIMQAYEFIGVEYLVGNYIDADQFMTSQHIREMMAAGWEMGSHSMNHVSLMDATPAERQFEIRGSRLFLEEKFGVPFSSFAYPFGEFDPGVINAVYDAGYATGMGLGFSSVQKHKDQYALHRIAVKGEYDLEAFEALLKRSGMPVAD